MTDFVPREAASFGFSQAPTHCDAENPRIRIRALRLTENVGLTNQRGEKSERGMKGDYIIQRHPFRTHDVYIPGRCKFPLFLQGSAS